MKPGINPFLAACLRSSLALALTLFGSHASAAPYTYTIAPNASPGSSWLAGAGWDSVPVSATDTTLNFVTGAALAAGEVNFSTNDIATVPFQLNRLSFTAVGPASGTVPVVTISGNNLEFISNGATAPTLNFASTGASAPTLAIENNLVFSNNISIQGSSNGTLSGVISGGGNITKTGGGLVTFSNAANTYTGNLTIDVGTIAITNAGALAGGSITVGSGDASAGSLRISGGITAGAGKSVTINGLGAGSTGALAGGSGTNVWEGGVVLGSAVSRIGVASGGTLLNVSGAISGTNGVVIRSESATQVVKFSGANTYTGQTRVAVGILEVSNIGNVGSGAGNLGNVSSVANGTIILGLGTANSGTVIPTLRYAGAGETTDRVIRVESGSTAAVTATINHNGTGTLRFNSDLVADGVATKTFTLTSAAAATGEFAGVIGNGTGGGALGITKTGSGLWNLLAANTYTGTTSVTGGTLRVSTNTALGTTAGGTTVGSSGLLQLLGGVTVTGESLSLAPKSSGNSLQSLAGTSEWAGAISTTVNTASVTDNTRITADVGSTLRLTGSITGNSSGASSFVLGDALTATAGSGLVFTGAGEIVSTGVISGPMSVISTNSNVVKIQGTENTYTGQTRIQSGFVEVSSLKNIGTASSLGNPLAAQAHILLQGAGVGIRYVGTGDTTDRPIAMAAGTNPNTIDQSGSGTLTFTADLVNLGTSGGQAKTLTLTGTGNGVFAGDLVNAASGSSVALGIAKTGAGTWTLSGDGNNYTGSTAVSGGTLKVGGSGINSSTTLSATGGGSLELIAGNVLGDAAAVTLNNGTLVVNGNAAETTGTLAVGASGGTLNMIGSLNELRFAQSSSATWSGNLAILNWSGLSTGGGDDQVSFGSTSGGITGAQVNRLQFVNPTVNGIAYAGTFGGTILTSGEIVALIPEPSAFLLGALGGLGFAVRRRRK